MKPARALLAAGLLAWGLWQRSASLEARSVAETLDDSLAAVLPSLDSAKAKARTDSAALEALRDSLGTARRENAATRARAEQQTSEARDAGERALASARAVASAEVRVYLDAHEREDSVAFAGYETQVATLEADTLALSTELAETRRQLLFARQSWDETLEALDLAIIRGDAWEQAANPGVLGKLVGGIPLVSTEGTIGAVIGVVGCLFLCPRGG